MTQTSSELRPGRRPRSLAAAVAAVMAVAFSVVTLPAPQARADEKTFLADRSAWFWSSNSIVTVCTRPRFGQDGVCQRTAGGDVAGPISTGHIGVSMKDGSSDMRGYVHFDTSLVPLGSEITRYVVVLNVSRADETHPDRHQKAKEKPPATVSPAAAAIQACAVSEFFPDGTEGDPPYSTKVTPGAPETPSPDDDETTVENFKNEPSVDCGLNADGVQSPDGSSWSFDITNIAKAWFSLARFDEGIALMPIDRSIKPTWVIEFHGAPRTKTDGDNEIEVVSAKEAARAIVEYTPASVPPPDGGGGGGFTGGGGGFTFPPADGSSESPPTDTTPPATTGGQQQTSTGGQSVPVGSAAKTPNWFYAFIPLLLLGIGLVTSLIGGDPLTAGAPSEAASSRVASVLRVRRLHGAGALEAAHAIEEEEVSTQD